jgi:hypothetical protein
MGIRAHLEYGCIRFTGRSCRVKDNILAIRFDRINELYTYDVDD